MFKGNHVVYLTQCQSATGSFLYSLRLNLSLDLCRVTLIEAQQVLGTFDAPLREYAANKLHKQGVHLVKVCLCLQAAGSCMLHQMAEVVTLIAF